MLLGTEICNETSVVLAEIMLVWHWHVYNMFIRLYVYDAVSAVAVHCCDTGIALHFQLALNWTHAGVDRTTACVHDDVHIYSCCVC